MAMLKNYSVRYAVIADIEKMIDLLNQLFSIEADFEIDPVKQRSGLELLLKSEHAQLFVAEDHDGNVVAMTSLQMVISTAEGGVVAWVEDVVVDVFHQGKGIGGILLSHITEWAESREIKRLQLVADKNNHSALDFYRKHDWSETELLVLRRKY